MKEEKKLTRGQRLQKAREAKGLTQAQLAEEVGCGQASISEIEKDHYLYKIDKLEAFCRVLEVSREYLTATEDIEDDRNQSTP